MVNSSLFRLTTRSLSKVAANFSKVPTLTPAAQILSLTAFEFASFLASSRLFLSPAAQILSLTDFEHASFLASSRLVTLFRVDFPPFPYDLLGALGCLDSLTALARDSRLWT